MHRGFAIVAATALLMSSACMGRNPLSPSTHRAHAVSPALVTSSGAVRGVSANSAEQIVFSGQTPEGAWTTTGATNVDDVGFWVWCEHKKANNSYAGECDGSVNVGDLSRGVSGQVHMDGDLDEHIMDVASKDGSLVCTLSDDDPAFDEGTSDTEVPHTQGPTNRVYVSCTTPTGVAGYLDGAVVRTTDSPPTVMTP